MLPRTQRLSPRARFSHGSSVKGRFLNIKYTKTDDTECQVGFVISKKVDKRAVRRNRLRRVLSDAFYKSKLRENGGYDILCIVISPVPDEQDDLVRKEFEQLLLQITL